MKPSRRRLALGAAVLGATLAVAGGITLSVTAGTSVGPDVTVIYLPSVQNYGSVGGVRAYAVGTTSCNVGTTPVAWCNNNGGCGSGANRLEDEDHPAIAQNLYRLKDGRFEQIGMSWLKHGFVSTNSPDGACGSCQSPPLGGDQLGVGCVDAYGASLNGSRPMGLRSEVNAATGEFPYPITAVGTSTAIDQRMQVLESEMDPATNSGAKFWIEGHYISPDDAAAGNALNNASYREVSIGASPFNITTLGSTIREKAAIFAWQVTDPEVEIANVDIPSSTPVQRFHVARKITRPSPSVWHYEFAVHNMNADRSANSFTVNLPAGGNITAVGFRDVNHHSGEPYATTDWTASVTTTSVTWETEDFGTNPNANALRWGTMFTFWFDSDAPPTAMTLNLGLFKPGTEPSVDFSFPGQDLFTDGFETGNTTAWATVVP